MILIHTFSLSFWSLSITDDNVVLKGGGNRVLKKIKVRRGCTVPSPLTCPSTKKSDSTEEWHRQPAQWIVATSEGLEEETIHTKCSLYQRRTDHVITSHHVLKFAVRRGCTVPNPLIWPSTEKSDGTEKTQTQFVETYLHVDTSNIYL